MYDIIRAIDRGEVTALVLLDLSSAFDTVDHFTLLDILHHRFAVEGKPLLCFKSYLTNWTQSFSVEVVQSKSIVIDCSVPQSSVLGPLEFISYTEDVVEIFIRPTRPSSPVRWWWTALQIWLDLWNWQYSSSIVSLHNWYPWLVFIASIAAECTEDGAAVVWQL